MRPDLQLFRILDPVLTMAAALTVQSPFVTRGNFDSTVRVALFLLLFLFLLLDRSAQARHEFDSPHGDAFTLLNLFDQWIKVKTSKPRVRSLFIRVCRVCRVRVCDVCVCGVCVSCD